ncbi:hypothetical protein HYZ41_02700 [archaeon]|nr:hypothetical protein [archaeon]
MEIEPNSRMLFMKYALPCAGTLVNRGVVGRDRIERLIDTVKENSEIPRDTEKIFKVAFAACSLIAMDEKKNFIDSNVIRKYFLSNHDDIIDKRFEEMGDFDPESCRIRTGTVVGVEDNFAIVHNSAGVRKYRIDFAQGIKKGDEVITHWDFVVEKVI